MNDIFDIYPQKFYLLSRKCRKLFSFESDERSLEHYVEEAFERLPRIEGGNVYAEFRFEKSMLDTMTRLSDSLKSKYPSIQQLPAFFKTLNEGDVFIRHQAWAPLCDLKRSIIKIKAIDNKRDLTRDDNIFVLNWGTLYLSYETYSYGFLTDKIYIGESDPTKRVCRFCQKTGQERFKKKAHSIMDALGNKLLFCNEECDECNQEFEKSVERDLYKLLEINRTLSNISGKNSQHNHLEGLNFHIHPDPGTHQPVVYIKLDGIVNDVYKGKPTGKLYLYNKGTISYYGVYKGLVKIAVDMIPSDKICHFKKTGQWVHGDFDESKLPVFLYGEHDDFFDQPVLDLFFRNEKSPHFSPYCTAVLYIYDTIFIYIIPFCDVDENESMPFDSLQSHLAFFRKKQYLFIGEWEELNPNNKSLLTPFYKIPVFSESVKYRIEYRPSTDKVFKREN